MTIKATPRQYDSWHNIIDDIPIATHLYYINKEIYQNSLYNLAPFSQSGQVLNLLYMPFLSSNNLELYEIPYDTEYYGEIDSETEHLPATQPNVYKVNQLANVDVALDLGNKTLYPDDMQIIKSDKKSWANESKLYQFPYYYISINDYINTPLKILPHLVDKDNSNQIDIKVRQPLSINGGYTVYVDGYKGDSNHGSNEGMLASAGLDLPTSSSQYAQFMATSKASFIAQNEISERNENVGMRLASQQMGASLAGNIASGVGGFFSTNAGGNIGSAVAGGINSLNQYSMTEQQIKKDRQNYIDSAQAQIADLKRSPRSVNLTSSDILMTLNRNNKELLLNRYHIQEYYLNKLCDYFTLYGYKQNKLMKINTKSRKYFNYIKTLDVNIKGSGIEKTELNQIKEIFNSGITFWHYKNVTDPIDGLAGGMYDYSKDNKEVKL